MPLLVTEAIVLHAFDYLESSRIVRLLTRDSGLRSGLAKGARKSQRRFGGGLDLFAQGTAFLHFKPGRDLDTLSAFDDARPRSALAADMERFTGSATIAEIVLRFGRDGADAELFDSTAAALDSIAAASGDDAREATLASAWQIVAALGFGPVLGECAACGAPLGQSETALFSQSEGGVVCKRCATLSPVGRMLPGTARSVIAGWMNGRHQRPLDERAALAHQRLLREFLDYHLHDGRALKALELWESASLSSGPLPTPAPDPDSANGDTPLEPALPG